MVFNYSSFTLFQDKESVGNLVKLIDKSNGYIFAGIEGSVVEFSKIAAAPVDWDYFRYPFPHFSLCAMCLLLLLISLTGSHHFQRFWDPFRWCECRNVAVSTEWILNF